MYIHSPRGRKDKKRGKSNRYRAKLKAKHRRRVNRHAGRKLATSRTKKN